MFIEGKNHILQKFFEWALYIFIALFPFVFYIGHMYYGTTSRAINLVVVVEILAITLGIALLSGRDRLRVAKSPITIALFILILTYVASAFAGVDFHTSFWSKATRMSGIFYFLHLGLFYLFLTMIFREEKKERNFLKVFVISGVIFCLGALLSRSGFNLIFTEKPWEGFTFGNSSFASMYIYAAFMASVYFVYSMEKNVRRWWHWLIPAAFVINPFFINVGVWTGDINIFKSPLEAMGGAQTSAYVTFISVIGLLGILLISKIKFISLRKKLIWIITGLGVVIFALAVHSLLTTGGAVQNVYLKQASSARPIVWESSGKSIAERPLLGWGTDNFDRSFEKNYDNRLLEEKNGAEAWFDRAHNIFVDVTVENGYVGIIVHMLVYAAIFGCLLYVLLRSTDKKRQSLATILMVYFAGHLIELQTAFDTTISYPALVVMTALAAAVFHRTYREKAGDGAEFHISEIGKKAAGGILILGFGALFVIGTVPIIRAETANKITRFIGSSEGRLEHYDELFGSPFDPATFLWRTISDFQRGIAEKPEVLTTPEKREGFAREIDFFVVELEAYLLKRPDDYRSHLTLANLYIYQRLFEIDNLDKAHEVLDRAEKLTPTYPQTHWMKAVAYLYQRKFTEARASAKKAYDLNPGVEQSQKIVDYIERSIKTFPEITLYNFFQI